MGVAPSNKAESQFFFGRQFADEQYISPFAFALATYHFKVESQERLATI
jgi:hypothetical protein